MAKLRMKKLTRELVAYRDNGLCQMCGKQATSQHHIVFKSHCGANIAPNLICLCNSCHRLVHSDEKKYRPILLDLQSRHYGQLSIEELKRGN